MLALKKYATFTGRSQRAEYWSFALINIAVIIGIFFLLKEKAITPVLIFSAITIVPGIAVGIRRMHDIGKSGWFILISLIPYVGGFIFLFFAVKDSQVGSNEYGANPKGREKEGGENAPSSTGASPVSNENNSSL